MVGNYVVKLGDKVCGTVRVERQGLYYQISCRCARDGDGIFRLILRCGGRDENLGVCVPMDGAFGVEKKISCKRLGQGTPEFLLLPKYEKQSGKFYPVYPDEPFAYLSRLKGAFLAYQAGQLGIVITE